MVLTTEAALVFHLGATSKCGTTSAARTATGGETGGGPRSADPPTTSGFLMFLISFVCFQISNQKPWEHVMAHGMTDHLGDAKFLGFKPRRFGLLALQDFLEKIKHRRV